MKIERRLMLRKAIEDVGCAFCFSNGQLVIVLFMEIEILGCRRTRMLPKTFKF